MGCACHLVIKENDDDDDDDTDPGLLSDVYHCLLSTVHKR